MSTVRALEGFHEATRSWFSRALGEPTAAQAQAWEAIARSEDTLVIAPTGSGKTLAAFLSALDRLLLPRPTGSSGTGMGLSGTEPGSSGPGPGSSGPGPGSSGPGPGSSADAQAGTNRPRTRVLYISPLKALGTDVHRNLSSPLVGIEQTAAGLGAETASVRVGIRTGDTPPAERRRLATHPPDILITTPESLFLMLSSAARETLTGVETVIIDEIHAIAGSKRGAHLALSLARLDGLVARSSKRPPQRIGLSATVEPQEEVAAFLGAQDGRAEPTIVRPAAQKRWEMSVCLPIRDFAAIEPPEDASQEEAVSGTIWPHVERAVLAEVLAHRSTIIFVNSRRQAERLTAALNRLYARRTEQAADAGHTGAGQAGADPEAAHGDASAAGAQELARAHHGSMSKERRRNIEEELKDGRLRCVVATNSLELGIDMGAVDLVVQVETPLSVASLLQRVGRAGHSVGDVSRGVLQPLHAADVLRAAVTVREALAGRIEPLQVPRNALDVLAQHTVSAALEGELEVEAWFARVRAAMPYSALPRSAFDAVIDLLTGRYPSTSFSDLRPRLVLDRERGVLCARPGAQRVVVTSGGTIPDRGLFPVYLVAGAEDAQPRRVGELDEEMVYESRRGDVVTLGTSSWRIEEITHDRVHVSPAFGLAGRIPFWHGDGAGRPLQTGQRIAAFMEEMAGLAGEQIRSAVPEAGLDENAGEAIATLLAEQQEATGTVPGPQRLLVERFRDELGDWRLILHCPLGQRITGPWALAVQARVEERFGLDGQVMASDDGIVLRIPFGEEAPGTELFLLEPEDADRVIRERITGSALFAARFREAAARALLLPRRDPSSRSPLWQQRQKAAQLLETASPHPQFPIMLEAARECLQDVYDLPALLDVLSEITRGRTQVVETETDAPSPLARSLLFGYLAQFIYDADAPMAERRSAALALDPGMLAELLGTTSLRELLDADVISRVDAQLQGLDERSRLRTAEQLADLLRRVGPLSAAGIAERCVDGTESVVLIEELTSQHRVIRVRIGGDERVAAVEDAALLRDGLGVVLPPGVPESLLEPVPGAAEQVVLRWARSRGPFIDRELQEELALAPSVAQMLLERCAADQQVQRGEFTPGREGEEWVAPEVLTRIRRASLAASREAVAPADPATYGLLLSRWHGVERAVLRGMDGVLTAIDQLAGVALPASVWESQVLAARVADFHPGLLDRLIASGEVTWTAHGRLGARDAWLRLHLTDALPLSLDAAALEEEAQRLAPGGLPARVLALLRSVPGALRFGEILQALAAQDADATDSADESDTEGSQGALPRSTGAVSGPELSAAIDELALASLITCDSLALPREWLQGSARAGNAPRPVPASRAGGRRRLGRRGAARLSAAMLRDASGAEGSAPERGWTGVGVGAGRWSAVRVEGVESTARSVALATLLLDRHAILTRGAFTVEEIPGAFAAVYRTLAAMEDSGSVRRGYFLDGLGASQFAASEAVDQLRDAERELTSPRRTPAGTVLAATDPANPYGASLAWPSLPGMADGAATEGGAVVGDGARAEGRPEADGRAGARPARRAGALVVLVDGAPAAFLDRGGRSLLWWADAEETALTAELLVRAIGARSMLPRMAIETINGAGFASPAAEPVAAALQEAGAYRSPKSVRIRAGDLHGTEGRRA